MWQITDVRSESIADKVYQYLLRTIGAGDIRAGERIFEKELASCLGISRTPIREALLRLESDGIIICNSRRSYNLRTFTAADVREIYETLGILEGWAIGRAGSRIETSELETLMDLNRRMSLATAVGDRQTFYMLNDAFHNLLLTKAGNGALQGVCQLLRRRLYAVPLYHRSIAKWLRTSVREHWEIIRLAKLGEREGISTYMRDVHWSYEASRRYIREVADDGRRGG